MQCAANKLSGAGPMDFTAVRKSEWWRDCVERNLWVAMHRAIAFPERVSERRRSSKFSSTTP
jgi:hypothetical protein